MTQMPSALPWGSVFWLCRGTAQSLCVPCSAQACQVLQQPPVAFAPVALSLALAAVPHLAFLSAGSSVIAAAAAQPWEAWQLLSAAAMSAPGCDRESSRTNRLRSSRTKTDPRHRNVQERGAWKPPGRSCGHAPQCAQVLAHASSDQMPWRRSCLPGSCLMSECSFWSHLPALAAGRRPGEKASLTLAEAQGRVAGRHPATASSSHHHSLPAFRSGSSSSAAQPAPKVGSRPGHPP